MEPELTDRDSLVIFFPDSAKQWSSPLSQTFSKSMHFHVKEAQGNSLSHMANTLPHCLLLHFGDIGISMCASSLVTARKERGPGKSTPSM